MKYSRNFLCKVMDALLLVKEDPRPNFGICWQVGAPLAHEKSVEILLESLFHIWPKFSGSLEYPVPGGDYTLSQMELGLWDVYTEYGRNRWELLDFLIEEVQAMIQEIDDYIEEHELEYLEDYK